MARDSSRQYYRNKEKQRETHDFYPTRPKDALTGLCALIERVAPSVQTILDPGAGLGVWGVEARAFWPDARLVGVELQFPARPLAYDEWIQEDFLTCVLPVGGFDLVIGNPPFDLAEPFVRRAIAALRPGGHLLFVLPVTFCTGLGREALFDEHPVLDMIVVPWRLSFVESGQESGLPYAFFLWEKGHSGPQSWSRLPTADRL